MSGRGKSATASALLAGLALAQLAAFLAGQTIAWRRTIETENLAADAAARPPQRGSDAADLESASALGARERYLIGSGLARTARILNGAASNRSARVQSDILQTVQQQADRELRMLAEGDWVRAAYQQMRDLVEQRLRDSGGGPR